MNKLKLANATQHGKTLNTRAKKVTENVLPTCDPVVTRLFDAIKLAAYKENVNSPSTTVNTESNLRYSRELFALVTFCMGQ